MKRSLLRERWWLGREGRRGGRCESMRDKGRGSRHERKRKQLVLCQARSGSLNGKRTQPREAWRRSCRNPKILTGLSHAIPRSIPPYAQTFLILSTPLCSTHGLHASVNVASRSPPSIMSPTAPSALRTEGTAAREALVALRKQYLLYTEQTELTISFVVLSHSRQVLSPCAAMDVLAIAASPLSNICLACPGECLR